MTFAHWLVLTFPFGFAVGVGYRVAESVPRRLRAWLDTCPRCRLAYDFGQARPWRLCPFCRRREAT